MLPHSVYGYFNNGGTVAYIVRIPDKAPAGKPAQLGLPSSDKALGNPLQVTTVENDANITVVIHPEDGDPEAKGPNSFRLSVLENGAEIESHENLVFGSGDRNVATVVNADSTKVKVKVDLAKDADLSTLIDVLKPGSYPLQKADPVPVPVSGKKFAGSESARTGINGLALADEVTMVIVPDLITAATKADGSVD